MDGGHGVARITKKSPADAATERAAADAIASPVEDAVIVPETAGHGPDPETETTPERLTATPARDEPVRTDDADGATAAAIGPGRTTIGPGVDAPGPDARLRRDDLPDTRDGFDGEIAQAGPATPDGPPRDASGPASAPPPSHAVERRGPGFLPLVLGGLVAGAIGYAIPTWLAPPDAPVADTARIEAVEARLATLSDAPDAGGVDLEAVRAAQTDLTDEIGALSDRIATLESRTTNAAGGATAVAPGDLASLAARLDETGARLDGFEGRLDALASDLEATTAATTDASDRVGAVAQEQTALSDRLGALTTRVDDLTTNLGRRIGEVQRDLTDATARTSSVEDEAQALAREAARGQVRQALQSGAAYDEPLAVLGEAPADLTGPAASGVATQAALVDDFPPLAREALRAARTAEPEAGVGSLLRSAFGARSLEPREGADPDAVLSRAEAALREGDLDAALSEVSAMPALAQAVLAGWSARARQRLAAIAAAADFLKDG